MNEAGFDPREDGPFARVQAAAQRRAAGRTRSQHMTEDEIVSACDAMPPDAAITLAQKLIRYATARKEPRT